MIDRENSPFILLCFKRTEKIETVPSPSFYVVHYHLFGVLLWWSATVRYFTPWIRYKCHYMYLSTIQQIVTLKVGEILCRYRKGDVFSSPKIPSLFLPSRYQGKKMCFQHLVKVLITWQNDKRATGARTLLTYYIWEIFKRNELGIFFVADGQQWSFVNNK